MRAYQSTHDVLRGLLHAYTHLGLPEQDNLPSRPEFELDEHTHASLKDKLPPDVWEYPKR